MKKSRSSKKDHKGSMKKGLSHFISATVIFFSICAANISMAYETTKPVEIQKYIFAPTPYGVGSLHRIWITIYDAELWLDGNKWSWDKTFALTLRYHLSVDSSDINQVSLQEMKQLFSLSDTQAYAYMKQLDHVMPNVKSGDVITALYIPNLETCFFLNGKQTGCIRDQELTHAFLSIWMDERTSEPELRRHLLRSRDEE